MDSISVTIGTLGLIENLNKIIKRLSDTSDNEQIRDAYPNKISEELSAVLDILTQSKTTMDQLLYQPTSVIPALTRCHEAIVTLEKQIPMNIRQGSRMPTLFFTKAPKVRKTLMVLKREVTDFTNALTIEVASKGTNMTSDAISGSPAERSSLFNATISIIVDKDVSSVPQSQRNASGIPCECGRSRMGIWFPVRGKFDNGSNADFVSEDVIKRAGLEPFVTRAEVPATLEMFGTTFIFNKKIWLSWVLNNHEKSYSADFWIAPNANNFDLIIGEPWLIKHGYGIIETHDSHSATSSYFGFLNIRLPWSSKAQRRAEEATEADLDAEANELLRQTRETALAPRPNISAVAGSASTGTAGPSMSASQTSNGSRSITPTSMIIGPVASGGNPHAAPIPTNTQRNPPP